MRPLLRRWSTADAAALHAAVAESPDLATHLGDADVRGVGDCAAFIDAQLARSSPSFHNFAVAVDGTAVGNVGISNIETVHDTAWVYYWLTRVNNPASCRVAAGAGFPADGVRRAGQLEDARASSTG
ncbi:hypothetical protein ATJ97_1400 [Georgenia soli]|uniref:N-acetyltransferase domain-containing protein n=1 Tax=Georgenia soli TaxID=638953 RepID=A0A2A9EL18_9MICO|nr:GNAT family N-acetyltransferase [Georgenia soli]PFG38909.1 hypothetical protein ATJ97_1400 [Georgenia soli]